MIKVRIPTPLRKLTGGQGEVTAQGENIAALIGALEKEYPGIKERLCDEQGELRRFVNIYINEEDIRFRQGIQTPVKKGDEVSIIPAIAGGERER
ncbi:MAG TPA: ubiquitin-like small modifier protein 1 [Candidatus Manganitrophaceae bacterium]|nr:ubiquitin-like small modifier protein 1 [Candidatus Manganitrophaceae bacterium]